MQKLVIGLIFREEDGSVIDATLNKYKQYPFQDFVIVASMSCVSRIMSHITRDSNGNKLLAGKPFELRAFESDFSDNDAFHAVKEVDGDKYLVLKSQQYPVIPPEKILNLGGQHPVVACDWYVDKRYVGLEKPYDSTQPYTPKVAIIDKSLMPEDWRNTPYITSLVPIVNE